MLISGAPAAYSVKYGFYRIFSSIDQGAWGFGGTGKAVSDLLVAPMDVERPGDGVSAAGTQYTWQPFLRGSMYYFNQSPWGASGQISVVWGDVAERYRDENGPGGPLGLPLLNRLRYLSVAGHDFWLQPFEKGLILYDHYGSNAWTRAFKKSTDILNPALDFSSLGTRSRPSIER